MRIAIYSNLGETSNIVATSLRKQIEKSQDLNIDGLNPEIVISVGGDGTLLSAFHHYQDISDKVRFIGIHTGHLGFYTDWRDYEVNDLVASLRNDNGQSVTYPLLDIKVNYVGGDSPDIGWRLMNPRSSRLVGQWSLMSISRTFSLKAFGATASVYRLPVGQLLITSRSVGPLSIRA